MISGTGAKLHLALTSAIWLGGCIPYFTGPSDGEVSTIKPGFISATPMPMLIEVERTLTKTLVGRVQIGGADLSERPLKYVKLALTDGKVIVAEASANGLGNFEFEVQLKQGDFWLRLKSEQFRGETKVSIRKAKTEGILIKAQRVSRGE